MKKRIFLILALIVMSLSGMVASAQEDETIVGVATSQADATTLGSVLPLVPEVEALLQGEGPFTLFLPLDTAFAAFTAENQEMLVELTSDTELLGGVVLYHVVPMDLSAEAIIAEVEAAGGTLEVPTLLEGTSVEVTLDADGNVLVNGMMVTETDITASNGTIHKIDGVLIPDMGLPPSYVMEIEAGAPGSEDDPLVVLLIPSENATEVEEGAAGIFEVIAEKTGVSMTPIVATDYAAAIEAMCNGEADIVALNTFSYVLASARGCADVGLVSVRFGQPFYQGQIVTLADSGIASYADLAGKTFCRPDALSTSGWIVPSIAIAANGIDIENDLEVIDVGAHDAVVTAVYNGDCDAGATFVDARTGVEDELADVMEKVVVLELSAPIPNDTISFSAEFDPAMRENLTSALVEFASDPANEEALGALYDWQGLEVADDSFFDDFREQLDASGVDIEELVN